jgi:hypothetical protein
MMPFDLMPRGIHALAIDARAPGESDEHCHTAVARREPRARHRAAPVESC